MAKIPRHVLIYEPSVDGHHVGWLRFFTEDLLAAGFTLTLAVNTRPASRQRIEDQMADLLPRVNVIPALSPQIGRKPSVEQVAYCLQTSGAALAFLAHFNDIASALLRRAALGWLPPASLRGRLGGVYLRPPLPGLPGRSPNELLKKLGFHRLLRQGWLNPLLLLEPDLQQLALQKYPAAPVHLLPDPCPVDFHTDRAAARRYFSLPDDQFVFLFYGGGYARKGLHLVAEALLKTPPSVPFRLLCAGLQPRNETLACQLAELQTRGRAIIVNRYVSAQEEKQLFAASDAVLLPYLNHAGTSSVLARAAGAGKPVVASDENYIGRIVRQYAMGPLFPTGDVSALQQALVRVATAPPAEFARWQSGARAFGETCSREVFRTSLVNALNAALP